MAGQTRLKECFLMGWIFHLIMQVAQKTIVVFECLAYFCNYLIKGKHKKHCQELRRLFVVFLKYRNIGTVSSPPNNQINDVRC